MDDVNINEMCLEEEVIADGDEWIKFSWIKQSDDNETSRQSLDVHKDINIETAQINDDDNKVLCMNTEADDISDGISIITESDTDTINTNILQISQFNGNTYRFLRILEKQINKQTNIRNVLMACIIGIIIGFILSHSFIDSKVCPNSNGINTENLKTEVHNIVHTLKGLTEDFSFLVKTMLNEIKTHTAVDKKIMEHFRDQFSKIDTVNKMSNKPIIISESFNFDPYSLNQVSQLQMSLHALSSLAFIYDNNSLLKNEINETLDIVNNTKAFYENLILLNNNTQNEYNSFALKILQHDSNKIHITSKLLLSNLIERISKITLNVYNKYTKEKHKLIKKLCDLKSILPDDEFLKQLTTNNQLFKNYDKSCLSNYSSKKLNTKIFEKKNTKIKNIKEQVRETDNTVVKAKYDKENSQKIYNVNKKGSLKNERTKKLNEYNYTITKFFQNASDKIHNISQLLSSELIENKREMLNKDIYTNKYNEVKHRWIKNKCHKDSSKFLERSTENNEENNKESINLCVRENNYLQSIEIQKDDMLKNNFDNILIQSWKDMCPLSTNSCSKFNIPTLPTTSSCKTENSIVNSNNEHDANSKESVLDYENSTKVLFRKSKPKQKDYSRSSDSSEKVFNNDGKNIKEKKKIFTQNKIKNPMSETNNYHKSKESSFKSRITKQDNQDYRNTNWQSDNKRFYRRKKQWQRGDSDWYFRRVFSRRKARRHAEDIYQWNTKLWNKYR
ncbi:putative uncharacterized protein DDB_G0282133 isoform X2 [Cataglyphis hispanica]|uniref:putative uncharacterized protein DDB_G0282133 isoform X2 n=1 Tax=Cataglyphis hispanica TaxID=1086592 RepID=UPI00217F68E0|nr:putative uncharacterized protein DDB_G0282133 isoform X2 [Cataglyphis hispanica]